VTGVVVDPSRLTETPFPDTGGWTTVAERRHQSAGVSRITDCVSFVGTYAEAYDRVMAAARELAITTGRAMQWSDYKIVGPNLVITFTVLDQD
jgi:hypothetical protein